MTKIANLLRILITDASFSLLVPLTVWFVGEVEKGFFVTCVLGFTDILNGFIKFLFCRVRPYFDINNNIKNLGTKQEIDYSFPSSHAQISASIYCAIIIKYYNYQFIYNDSILSWIALFIVFITGFARVYLGVHWPSCVVSGWIIGIVFVCIFNECNIIDWFIHLTFNRGITVAVLFFVVTYLIFVYLKYFVSFEKNHTQCTGKRFQELEGTLQLNPQTALSVTKYCLQISSVCGAMIGTHLSNHIMQSNFHFMFLFEQIYEYDFNSYQFRHSFIIRALVGIVGICMVAIFGFIVPALIKNSFNNTNKIKSLIFTIKTMAFMFSGLWTTFGCPFVSFYYFDATFDVFNETYDCVPQYNGATTNINFNNSEFGLEFQDGLYDDHMLPFVNDIGEWVTETCMGQINRPTKVIGTLHDRIANSTRLHVPENIDELQYIVKQINAYNQEATHNTNQLNQTKKLRVIGAGMSFPTAQFTMANNNENNHKRKVEFVSLEHFNHYKNNNDNTVTVGAGLSVCGNFLLNHTRNHISNVTWNYDYSLVKRLQNDGLAVNIIGGICKQSIGGWITTATSGGSMYYSPINNIINIKMVNGNGDLIEFNKDRDDNFNLASISMGLIGIIHEVTLKVEPYYCTKTDGKYLESFDYDAQDYSKQMLHDMIKHHSKENDFFHIFLSNEREYDVYHNKVRKLYTMWESANKVNCTIDHDETKGAVIKKTDYISTPKDEQVGMWSVLIPFASNPNECIAKYLQSENGICDAQSIRYYLDYTKSELGKRDMFMTQSAINVFESCLKEVNKQFKTIANDIDINSKSISSTKTYNQTIQHWFEYGPSIDLFATCLGPTIQHPTFEYNKLHPRQSIVSDYYKMIAWEQGVQTNEFIDNIMILEQIELFLPIMSANKIHPNSFENIIFTIVDFMDKYATWEDYANFEIYFSPRIDMNHVSAMHPSHSYDCLRLVNFQYPFQSIEKQHQYLNKGGLLYHQFYQLIKYFVVDNNIKLRLHWGKHIPLYFDSKKEESVSSDSEMIVQKQIVQMLRNEYPLLNQFKTFATQHDPNNIFVTEYWNNILWN